jgi:predicted nucleic acid-binding protein
VIVLDTTVLVYAVGGEHPLREPSRRLVEAIGAGRIDATTTVEVIQEFVHIRARRQGRADAAKVGRNFAELLAPLLVVQESRVEGGLRIFERSTSLSVRSTRFSRRLRSRVMPTRSSRPTVRSPQSRASRTSSPARPSSNASSRPDAYVSSASSSSSSSY